MSAWRDSLRKCIESVYAFYVAMTEIGTQNKKFGNTKIILSFSSIVESFMLGQEIYKKKWRQNLWAGKKTESLGVKKRRNPWERRRRRRSEEGGGGGRRRKEEEGGGGGGGDPGVSYLHYSRASRERTIFRWISLWIICFNNSSFSW